MDPGPAHLIRRGDLIGAHAAVPGPPRVSRRGASGKTWSTRCHSRVGLAHVPAAHDAGRVVCTGRAGSASAPRHTQIRIVKAATHLAPALRTRGHVGGPAVGQTAAPSGAHRHRDLHEIESSRQCTATSFPVACECKKLTTPGWCIPRSTVAETTPKSRWQRQGRSDERFPVCGRGAAG